MYQFTVRLYGSKILLRRRSSSWHSDTKISPIPISCKSFLLGLWLSCFLWQTCTHLTSSHSTLLPHPHIWISFQWRNTLSGSSLNSLKSWKVWYVSWNQGMDRHLTISCQFRKSPEKPFVITWATLSKKAVILPCIRDKKWVTYSKGSCLETSSFKRYSMIYRARRLHEKCRSFRERHTRTIKKTGLQILAETESAIVIVNTKFSKLLWH